MNNNPVHPHFIGLRILVPAGRANAIAPQANHVATVVLNRLIQAELSLEGIESKSLLCGPFNELVGMIEADDLDKTLLVVERTLADCGFTRPLVQIGWHDELAGCWRLHPEGDAPEFNELFENHGEGIQEKLAAWKSTVARQLLQ